MKRKYIEENLELIGEDFLSDFTEALLRKDSEKTLKNLDFLGEKSLDVRLFLEQLLYFLRDRMRESLKKTEFSSYAEIFQIFEGTYGRLKYSPDPFLLLETTVFRCISSHTLLFTEPVPIEKQEAKNFSASPKKAEKSSPIPPVKKEKYTEIDSSPKPEIENIEQKPNKPFDFGAFIEYIRTVPKRSFVGLGLRVSTYAEEGNSIVIYPDNDFNYQKLNASSVRLFLQETLDTVFGPGYTVDIQK